MITKRGYENEFCNISQKTQNVVVKFDVDNTKIPKKITKINFECDSLDCPNKDSVYCEIFKNSCP